MKAGLRFSGEAFFVMQTGHRIDCGEAGEMGKPFYKIIEVTDYGPFVVKVVLPVGVPVKAGAVDRGGFSVYVERKDPYGHVLMLPKSWTERGVLVPSRGHVTVLDAYPSDLDGTRRDEGPCVTLELEYGPGRSLTAEIAPIGTVNRYVFCDYRITQTADIDTAEGTVSGLVFDRCAGGAMKQAEGFLHGVSTFGEPLKYGYFVPQTGGGKRPLIVWLHGAGEGGDDPRIAYTGNKVVNLASPGIQAKFGGAYVLVPQAPTFWMDDGSGTYGRSGKSRYAKALKALIDEFIEKNETGIDRNRIYIGGCSNGGFMTMRMIIDYADFFAAAFPVCEALYDEVIRDEQIEAIRHMPIWFVHAKNDAIVKPEETSVPTYHRLIRAGAKNVHFTFFDRVVDLHGTFRDENGRPYEYDGHFAWIHVLNDDCRIDFDGRPVVADGREVTLFDWLALQRKG